MSSVRINCVLLLAGAVWLGCGESQVSDNSVSVVDVLGNPTRVRTLGFEGRRPDEPVLFLMAGAGADIGSWGDWISMISAVAPVVTYDRPGIGGSRFDGIDPTPERVVEHAHEVLKVLEVLPPYILVGHSWGGLLIRYYAGQYPEDIVGMVYLDPSELTLSLAEFLGASNEEELTERLAQLDSVGGTLSLPPGIEAEARMMIEFRRTPVADRGLPDEPDVPTTVLLGTRTPGIRGNAPSYRDEHFFEEWYAGRVSRFAEWTQRRPNTTLIVATDLSHFVHRDDPDLALEAVRRVVVAVRDRR